MRNAAVLAFLCVFAIRCGLCQEAGTTGSSGTTTGSAPASTSAGGTTTGSTSTGGTTAARPTTIPKDSSKEWRVGITAFTSDGLSRENAYLASSLPLLLRNELSGLGSHHYDEEEKDRARGKIIETEIAATEKSLTSARGERDALLFNRVPEGTSARTEVETRVVSAQVRLAFLHTLPAGQIEIADEKPVSFKDGSEAGRLLAAPTVSPEAYCTQQGLDLLVGGSIAEVQGYLLLDVWAYDPLAGRRDFSTRDAATREDMSASIPVFAKEIARTILGRPWAMVAFNPTPPNAALYVDGILLASGATPALYLAPGTHDIRLAAKGFEEISRTIDLDAESRMTIDDTLVQSVTGQVAISSDPSGADLYLDSLWLGKTPLTLDRPPLRSRGVLSMKGYYESAFSLEPLSPPELSFTLQPDKGSRDIFQKQARDEFYTSFGIFALSLPLPIFSYALAIDFALKEVDLTAQGLDSRAAQAHSTSTILLGTYYVGIAVSAALFTWMVTRIVHYVQVANDIAG